MSDDHKKILGFIGEIIKDLHLEPRRTWRTHEVEIMFGGLIRRIVGLSNDDHKTPALDPDQAYPADSRHMNLPSK